MSKRQMQKMFSKAYLGVMNQGDKSSDSHSGGTKCMYRGAGGFACGIGHMITDKEYDPAMDDKDGFQPTEISDVIHLFPKRIQQLPSRFLLEIQDAHDQSHGYGDVFREAYKKRMGEIAKQFDLKLPKWKKEKADG